MSQALRRGRWTRPTAHGSPAEQGRPRYNRDFRLLWAGQALSVTAGNAAMLALPLFILARTGSPLLAGLIDAAWLAISAAAALPCGAIADRSPKRRVLVAADLGRAAAMLALALAITSGWTPLGLILALVAVNAVADSLFSAAMPSALKKVVPPDRLTSALASNQVRNALAGAVGPPLGGLLLATGPALPFAAGTIGYLSSALAVLAIRGRLPDGARPAGGRRSELTAGLAYVVRDRFQRDLLLIATGVNLVFGGVYLVVTVGGASRGVSAPAIGLTVALTAAGSMLGAVASPRVQARLSARTACLALLGGGAVLVPLMAIAPNAPLLAVTFACCVVPVPVINVIAASVRLARTPDDLQGRAASASTLIALSAAPLGPLLAGLLIDQAGRAAGFLAFGGLLTLLAVYSTTSRTLRTTVGQHLQPPVMSASLGGASDQARSPGLRALPDGSSGSCRSVR